MQFEQTKDFIVDKLRKELPKNLAYHTLDHVLDVYQAAENLGTYEHISDHEMRLLLTASLFHDSGFIYGPSCHEEESCKFANQYLPGFGYTEPELVKINGMIMATKIPQSPNNLLEQIICDADLDYLGRDDFFPISETLFAEFQVTGVVNNVNDWNKLQVTFFEKHHYFTGTALKLRQPKKELHLQAIKLKIK